MKHLDLPGLFVLAAVAIVFVAACYRCLDPGCTNVPPVDPSYPPTQARDGGRD